MSSRADRLTERSESTVFKRSFVVFRYQHPPRPSVQPPRSEKHDINQGAIVNRGITRNRRFQTTRCRRVRFSTRIRFLTSANLQSHVGRRATREPIASILRSPHRNPRLTSTDCIASTVQTSVICKRSKRLRTRPHRDLRNDGNPGAAILGILLGGGLYLVHHAGQVMMMMVVRSPGETQQRR